MAALKMRNIDGKDYVYTDNTEARDALSAEYGSVDGVRTARWLRFSGRGGESLVGLVSGGGVLGARVRQGGSSFRMADFSSASGTATALGGSEAAGSRYMTHEADASSFRVMSVATQTTSASSRKPTNAYTMTYTSVQRSEVRGASFLSHSSISVLLYHRWDGNSTLQKDWRAFDEELQSGTFTSVRECISSVTSAYEFSAPKAFAAGATSKTGAGTATGYATITGSILTLAQNKFTSLYTWSTKAGSRLVLNGSSSGSSAGGGVTMKTSTLDGQTVSKAFADSAGFIAGYRSTGTKFNFDGWTVTYSKTMFSRYKRNVPGNGGHYAEPWWGNKDYRDRTERHGRASTYTEVKKTEAGGAKSTSSSQTESVATTKRVSNYTTWNAYVRTA